MEHASKGRERNGLFKPAHPQSMLRAAPIPQPMALLSQPIGDQHGEAWQAKAPVP